MAFVMHAHIPQPESTMADERKRQPDADEPFRESESGASYNPQGNWGAERRTDGPKGGAVTGAEGAPSGAGDGGFGPEGDYAGSAGDPNAKVLGQVNGTPDALEAEAHNRDDRTPDR